MFVAVLTPSLTGQVHIEHANSMGALRVQAAMRGVRFQWLFNKGSSNLVRNRNVLAAEALARGADWLMWIDSDIAFDPADVFRLIDHNVALVGAAPQKRTQRWGEPGAIAGDFALDAPDFTPNGLIRARGVPTAFQLVRASVFDRIEAGPLRHVDSPEDVNAKLKAWFWHEMEQGQDLAEDYTFCRRCHRAGIETLIDPAIRLRHYEGLVEHSLSLSDVLAHMEQAKQQQAAE